MPSGDAGVRRPDAQRDRIRAVCGFPLTAAQHARLESAAPQIVVVAGTIDSQLDIDDRSDHTAEILFADYAPSDLTRWPSLRWLQYSGAGVDALSGQAPWSKGVTVTTASGANAVAVAEYVLAAVLGISQRAAARRARQVDRCWATSAERAELVGRSMARQTITAVGYGSIGREIARLAHAFGMRVLAVKARPSVRVHHGYNPPGRGDPNGVIPERIVGPRDLGAAVGAADVVVVAAPLTDRTRASLGTNVLAAMRRDAWLVNVGRGDLFVESQLIDAIEHGRLAGAVLDVTATEPLPADSALWDLANTVVTPHVAGDFDGVWDAVLDLAIENLRRYVCGRELFNVVEADGY